MFGSRPSLPPRRVLALSVGVTVMLLATLMWLGWRLIQQDRILEAQQIQQRLERSADLIAASLERALAGWEQRLAAGVANPPEGAVIVTIRGEEVTVSPRSRVSFLPSVPALPEPPAATFTAGDQAEYQAHDFQRANALFVALTRATDHATRTGAWLRLARVQQSLGQVDVALATYASLLNVNDVAIAGVPAALVARYARCRLLEAHGRHEELALDASALLRDLHSARWPLTAPVYWLYADDASRWAGAGPAPSRDEDRFASAVAALTTRPWASPRRSADDAARAGEPRSGRDLLEDGKDSVTVLWRSTSDSVVAFLAMPSFVRREWLAATDAVARDQKVVLSIGSPPAGTATVPFAITRNAAQTHLPWTIAVRSADPAARQSEFVLRHQLLVGGFLLLLLMALAASYVIIRAVSRELAVARLQSDFVATVSHEFRTPLTTLRQFTDMLREGAGLTDERRRICYDAQSRATDRLTRLVESLLDFGRLEAGAHPYTFERQDVTTLVESVVDDFRIDATAAGHALQFHGNGSVPIPLDREAFSRAVWNLLDNALKYSPGDRPVEVDVRREAHDVVVAVRDYGLGIPASEQSAIFTQFHRGTEARARGIRGTGLGLAMVDRIVRAHQGRVEVVSEPGQGSTFKIMLPLSLSSVSPEP